MINKLIICTAIIFAGCSYNTQNTRSFNFIYEIDIESTNNQKLELWVPYPQSNEVQKISNVQINSNGLNYTIENENIHNNKYIYINHKTGTSELTKFTMSFDVIRKEHQNVNYKNVNPQKYLGSYNTVPTGEIFTNIIKQKV